MNVVQGEGEAVLDSVVRGFNSCAPLISSSTRDEAIVSEMSALEDILARCDPVEGEKWIEWIVGGWLFGGRACAKARSELVLCHFRKSQEICAETRVWSSKVFRENWSCQQLVKKLRLEAY